MITNEFFQGYYQALDTVEEDIKHLIKQYEKSNVAESVEALKLIQSHIQQVRFNYKTLQRQLADGQKKK